MRNDVLFDAWTDAHYDDVLEREFLTGVTRLARVTRELLSVDVERDLAISAVLHSETRTYSRKDALMRLEGMDFTDAEAILADLVANEFSFEYQIRGLRLKCYAHIGHFSGGNELEPVDMVRDDIAWGERILSEALTVGEAPFFNLVLMAARARLALDTHANPTIDDFINLAALVRWPVSESFEPGLLDIPRKTIQNLLAGKTLERVEDSLISHASATEWLLKQVVEPDMFPSLALLPDEPDSVIPTIDDPIFIPVSKPVFGIEATEFLPDQRHEDGYIIRRSDKLEFFPDYFEALQALQSSPSAWFRPHGTTALVPLGPVWKPVSKSDLDRRLKVETEMAQPSAPRSLTEQFEYEVASDPSMRVHKRGHSQKMFRFACTNGSELAIEKRVGSPVIYVRDEPGRRTELGGLKYETRTASLEGRNSNLNAMATFRNAVLLAFKPENTEEMKRILAFVTRAHSTA